jgi:hypothetical protein
MAREVQDGSCTTQLQAFGDGVRAAKSAVASHPADWSAQPA